MKLLVQHGDLLDRGFLSRDARHLEFQLSDIFTRPGGNHRFRQLEVVLAGKYVGEDVRSIRDASLGGGMSTDGEVDANDANVFLSERLTTERAGGGETRRRL